MLEGIISGRLLRLSQGKHNSYTNENKREQMEILAGTLIPLKTVVKLTEYK